METHETARLIGFISFTLAAIAVFQRSHSRDSNKLGLLAGIFALLAVEVLVEARYVVGNFVRVAGLYSVRAFFQVFIILSFVIIADAILRNGSTKQNKTNRLIEIAAASVLLTFFVESISLHTLDQVFYYVVGPLPIVSWLWLIAAAVALVGSRQKSALPLFEEFEP